MSVSIKHWSWEKNLSNIIPGGHCDCDRKHNTVTAKFCCTTHCWKMILVFSRILAWTILLVKHGFFDGDSLWSKVFVSREERRTILIQHSHQLQCEYMKGDGKQFLCKYYYNSVLYVSPSVSDFSSSDLSILLVWADERDPKWFEDETLFL